MAKKYLNLEEAADALGISTGELNKLRERGAVRGFADQSSWKFRTEDIQNYAKTAGSGQQDDSSILSDDDEPLGESPSDIRLILDEDLSLDESMADIPSVADSGEESPNFDETQIDSNLNLHNIPNASDADQTVLTPSDDDIQLLGDGAIASDDSYINLGDEEVDDEGLTLASGSSILLGGEDESGVALEEHDSGITLSPADSGISLESLDSSINIRLDQNTFSLEDDGAILGATDDSGISLDSDEESSIVGKKGDSGNLDGTVEMDITDDDDFSLEDTAFEIEATTGSSEYELSGMGADSGDEDTSVLLLDDDDDSSAVSPTALGAADVLSDAFDSETFDLADGGDFDDFGGDSDLLMEETVVGDDDDFDDMELDAFAAVDEDFEFDDAEVGDGGSFTGPVGMGRVPVSQEVELGTGTFVGVLLSSIFMAVCGLMMVDLIRGMWSYQQLAPYNSALLDMIKSIFG
ncbi:MAG TPA: helix-turn-helix domain-containing protein [Planctomycetaceae bacterium]|nr:helix-turn-helix domain-containing protein [Planctomycetaceae bacterium]